MSSEFFGVRVLAASSVILGALAVNLGATARQTSAVKLHDSIFQSPGKGNTYLVTTPGGNVVIDTGTASHAAEHKKLLEAANSGPVKFIILTHGHEDHRGGVSVWKAPRTEVIAQKNYAEFYSYQCRLAPFFARRMAAQFKGRNDQSIPASLYDHPLDATILYDEEYNFELGGIRFELYHTPGETYDHTSVWIPQFKAAFVGDNYSKQFPAIYTLRGTKPRWALDYVESLNKVLNWKPELLLPGHGDPLSGSERITATVSRLRDAIRYVHDETVRGMNEGKDASQLMRDIKLPQNLEMPQDYGTVAWSVRGIYEGYAGWFDENPTHMYVSPRSPVITELVNMAGGPIAVARRGREMVEAHQFVEALQLTDFVLEADPHNTAALETRLAALQALLGICTNPMERGWLEYGVAKARQALRP